MATKTNDIKPAMIQIAEELSDHLRKGYGPDWDNEHNASGQLLLMARLLLSSNYSDLDMARKQVPADWKSRYDRYKLRPLRERVIIAAGMLVAWFDQSIIDNRVAAKLVMKYHQGAHAKPILQVHLGHIVSQELVKKMKKALTDIVGDDYHVVFSEGDMEMIVHPNDMLIRKTGILDKQTKIPPSASLTDSGVEFTSLERQNNGMTRQDVLDLFAATAIKTASSCLTDRGIVQTLRTGAAYNSEISRIAYDIADAMIKERERRYGKEKD